MVFKKQNKNNGILNITKQAIAAKAIWKIEDPFKTHSEDVFYLNDLCVF